MRGGSGLLAGSVHIRLIVIVGFLKE
jgi:hypothetical protein